MVWDAASKAIAYAIAIVGGVVLVVGRVLRIYYNSTSNRLRVSKAREKEESAAVERRAQELLELAFETARKNGGSVLQMISFNLESSLDMMAARELSKNHRATIEGNKVTIEVNILPREIARDLSRRGGRRSR